MSKTKAGLYVHIPFCSHACGYCAFAKQEDTPLLEKNRPQFLDAIKKELENKINKFGSQLDFDTLYIGGGTPSLLKESELEKLFSDIYSLTGSTFKEVSFDCNPEDLVKSDDYVKKLEQMGVTRLTIGVQTLSEQGLKILERRASVKNILRMADNLPKIFSGEISYDLILAWPGQTLKEFVEKDVPFLRNSAFNHLSLYLINYEQGTRLNRDVSKGKVKRLDEDTASDIWERCLKETRTLGMEQYEISSFCKNKAYGKHNISTWKNQPYLGIGPGAVSRVGKVRWTNTKILNRYIQKTNSYKQPAFEAEYISSKVAWQDELIFGLRYKEGIELLKFNQKHAFDLLKVNLKGIEQGVKEKHLELKNSKLSFTPLGWNYFDAYLSDWMNNIETFIGQ